METGKYTVTVCSNETADGDYLGEVVVEFTAATPEACAAWVAQHYDANDYTWSYS